MTITKPKDPLLNGARIVTIIAYALLTLVMAGVIIGTILAATAGRQRVMQKLAELGAPADGIWILIAAGALIVAMLYTGLRFLKELRGIINSVGEGDPFHPENAQRLRRMGWFAVAGQAIALPLAGIETWLALLVRKTGHHLEIGFGVGLGSILLILILFILARVFRKGAEMQEELEGTV